MRLIIAEKPSVARGIADVLGHASKNDGCIVCGDTTVTWCAGHLLEQADPEVYVNGGSIGRQDLPVLPSRWQLQAKDDRAKHQINVIKVLLKKADEVVNAGDSDREGQLLVDELLIYLGWQGKTLRLWLSSLDEESVRRALASLKPNDAMRSLYEAALARQRADWLLGLNGSIALSRNLKSLGLDGGWSVGRVQTPTLALIVDRHAQIKGHVKQEHYKVQITLQDSVSAWWQIPDDLLTDGLLLDKQRAEQAATAVEGKTGTVVNFTKRQGTRAAPLPYSLSALQMEANSRFGFSAKQTLDLAQLLYEAKVITYPRSDCRYLPEEMHSDAKRILSSPAVLVISSAVSAFYKFSADWTRKHAAWNTTQISAHHAIIPTGQDLPDEIKNKDEAYKLYQLICGSYVHLFLPDEEFEQRQATFRFGDDLFNAAAKKIINPGWTALGLLYVNRETQANQEADGQNEPNTKLPNYTEGQSVECQQASVQVLETKPPKPYNDKTLIAAMTGIHKLVTDPKLKARLKETSGIGTEATRAAIIETLMARGYIKREGKAINPTERGIKLIDMVRKTYPALADPGATAEQEDALADIAIKKLAFDGFMETVVAKTREEVQALFSDGLASGSITLLKCPACGKPSAAKLTSKAGKPYWKCRDCQTAFGDDHDKPGQAFKKKDDGQPRPKPEVGPACPHCKQKTGKYLTKTGKPYFRCGKCSNCYWPDFNDANKIGKQWKLKQ